MSPSKKKSTSPPAIQGLSDLLIGFADPARRKDIEEFRIQYENEHGPTDLTKRYTSLWPTEQQDWLADHYPKRYWDGLPPYVQAYFRKQAEIAAGSGKLDDLSPMLIRLFLKREMDIGGDGPVR